MAHTFDLRVRCRVRAGRLALRTQMSGNIVRYCTRAHVCVAALLGTPGRDTSCLPPNPTFSSGRLSLLFSPIPSVVMRALPPPVSSHSAACIPATRFPADAALDACSTRGTTRGRESMVDNSETLSVTTFEDVSAFGNKPTEVGRRASQRRRRKGGSRNTRVKKCPHAIAGHQGAGMA